MNKIYTTPQPTFIFEKCPILCAFLLITAFSLLRLWIAGSGQLDLAQDEAQYWDWSRRLQLSYYSKGPLIAWIIRTGTTLFGDTELGVRFFAVVNNTLVQCLLFYWLAFLVKNIRLAFITLLLANSIPLFIVSGVLMTTDNPLMVCWLLALFSVHQLGEHPDKKWVLWMLGATIGLGILAKYTMLLMVPLALFYLALLVASKQIPAKTLALAGASILVGVCLGMLPIILWNMDNGFASFWHVARLAGVSGAPSENIPLFRFDRFPEYLGGQAGLILPWWLGIMLWQGARMLKKTIQDIRQFFYSNAKNSSLQNAASSQNNPQNRFRLLLCLGFWPLWLFFIIWSFHTRIYPNWSAMSYVAGVIITAMGIEHLLPQKMDAAPSQTIPSQKKKPYFSGKKWLPVWAMLSFFVCITIHGQHFLTKVIPLPEQINPTVRLKGWSDLGKELEKIRLSMPDPNRVFFFSDAYDVTAALAFYAPNQPVTYCADFGRRLSQYDFWQDPNNDTFLTAPHIALEEQHRQPSSPHYAWNAVYVSRRPVRKIPEELFFMFDHVGEKKEFQSMHEGQKGRVFGLIEAAGYTGRWGRPSQGIY